MAEESEIRAEVFNLYKVYAKKIGKNVSSIKSETKLAFPSGIQLSKTQRQLFTKWLNEILLRYRAAKLLKKEVLEFKSIKDAEDKVWTRIESVTKKKKEV